MRRPQPLTSNRNGRSTHADRRESSTSERTESAASFVALASLFLLAGGCILPICAVGPAAAPMGIAITWALLAINDDVGRLMRPQPLLDVDGQANAETVPNAREALATTHTAHSVGAVAYLARSLALLCGLVIAGAAALGLWRQTHTWQVYT
mmetsp:Transcript_15467/g.35568  ORF Transcript_15467/g.35568 Transcript_15467/m.35568 type:complete len:152 (-) Transcript_15467:287-742(-)